MSKHTPPERKRIAFLGESPNDTVALQTLFERRYPGVFDFYIMLRHVRGSVLDDDTTKRAISIEYRYHKPDYIIVVRDLDDLSTNKNKIRKMKANFREVNKILEGKGLFLLNIYELEALLLSDIDSFNSHFSCTAEYNADPMLQHEPKEVLMELTKDCKYPYKESDTKELFKTVNFDKLLSNCRYFREFVSSFEKLTKLAA